MFKGEKKKSICKISVAVVIFQGEIDEISPVIQWNTSLITKTAIFFVFRNVLYYEAI